LSYVLRPVPGIRVCLEATLKPQLHKLTPTHIVAEMQMHIAIY
jgi:hypothetical protein